MAESRWAGTLFDVKITHFLGSIFFLARTRNETETRSLHYINRLIGDIAMVICM